MGLLAFIILMSAVIGLGYIEIYTDEMRDTDTYKAYTDTDCLQPEFLDMSKKKAFEAYTNPDNK